MDSAFAEALRNRYVLEAAQGLAAAHKERIVHGATGPCSKKRGWNG
jgi:hypothetical protein